MMLETSARRLSVITPCYNSLERLLQTVESVQEELRNAITVSVEHIIVDGDSTDGTIEYFQRVSLPGLMFITRKDGSLYEAIADGLRKSTGGSIILLGAGDLLLSGAAESIVESVIDLRVLWGSGLQHFHGSNDVLGSGFARFGPAVLPKLAHAGAYGRFAPAIQQESTFFSRELLSAIDFEYLSSLKLAGDSYIWGRFSTQAKHRRVSFVVGSFMLHEGQLSENTSGYRAELSQIFPPWRWWRLLIPLLAVNAEWTVRNILSRSRLRARSN